MSLMRATLYWRKGTHTHAHKHTHRHTGEHVDYRTRTMKRTTASDGEAWRYGEMLPVAICLSGPRGGEGG